MTRLNKKGFTLVELLAVIAILAILMLLITPNILNLFTQGKKDLFKTQVQRIWKAADQEYITASMQTGAPGPYCYAGDESSDNAPLSITENKNLFYYVDFDDKGNVSVLKVTDGVYYYDSSQTEFTLGMDSIEGKPGKGTINCATGEMTVK
jgi:type IV pilus assembly protein PilA